MRGGFLNVEYRRTRKEAVVDNFTAISEYCLERNERNHNNHYST
jgi:hypothetical protein